MHTSFVATNKRMAGNKSRSYRTTAYKLLPFALLFVCIFSTQINAADDASSHWSKSGHADSKAEAFTHWDEEGTIPENCAACHAESGFLDFIGTDNSTPMKVDKPHPTGSVVGCNVCHNERTETIDSIRFPSGVEITASNDGSTTCMVCHQGRASTNSVNEKLGDTGVDTVNTELGFINIHYKAAAATLYGTEVKGGYEYQGNTYQGKFAHISGLDSCSGCHNPHSLEVSATNCTNCHVQASTALNAIRIDPVDYDGDENSTEGIAAEIESLHSSLGVAIVAYADQSLDSQILYDAHRYPYFFHDTNKNMAADEGEIQFSNRYQTWTPRLLRAAYNYQYVAKDTGAYAHNPKYALQLLYDSLESLSEKVDIEMDMIARP